MSKISFYEFGIHCKLEHKQDIKKFLGSLFRKEMREVNTVNIILSTDEYLLRLNKDYLNHNYFTDTISFILSDPNEAVVGEAYLSIDRIKLNARQRGISFKHELLRVIIHSCLHLCGYSDNTRKAKKEMETIQEDYLSQWLVSRETKLDGKKA